MVHLGVVLVLLGAAMGKALAIRGQVALPVTPHHAMDRLTSGPEGSSNEMATVVLVWTGVAGSVLASAAFGVGRERAGTQCLAAAWLACAGLFGLNWWHTGEPPFGNMYHVLIFLALSVPALYAILSRFADLQWAGIYFAVTTALALTGAGFMDRDVHWRRMAATAQTLAFTALLWTFFLVNLWPRLASALHSYAR